MIMYVKVCVRYKLDLDPISIFSDRNTSYCGEKISKERISGQLPLEILGLRSDETTSLSIACGTFL